MSENLTNINGYMHACNAWGYRNAVWIFNCLFHWNTTSALFQMVLSMASAKESLPSQCCGFILHICTIFSSQRYSRTYRLPQILHMFTITKLTVVLNERSAVKNSVHIKEICFEDPKKPQNVTYSFLNVKSY